MDYFAVGRPTVACAVGEVVGLLNETQAGLLAPPAADSFASLILRLLGDRALQTRLGQNARRAAETTYSWAHIASRLEVVYDRLL
jgi:glycosyltransferase involved in cell wall biosynthesis